MTDTTTVALSFDRGINIADNRIRAESELTSSLKKHRKLGSQMPAGSNSNKTSIKVQRMMAWHIATLARGSAQQPPTREYQADRTKLASAALKAKAVAIPLPNMHGTATNAISDSNARPDSPCPLVQPPAQRAKKSITKPPEIAAAMVTPSAAPMLPEDNAAK